MGQAAHLVARANPRNLKGFLDAFKAILESIRAPGARPAEEIPRH